MMVLDSVTSVRGRYLRVDLLQSLHEQGKWFAAAETTSWRHLVAKLVIEKYCRKGGYGAELRVDRIWTLRLRGVNIAGGC